MSAPPPDRLVAAHEDATAFYSGQLPAALPALRYLNSRGIIAATAHRAPWTLGYAPGGWTALPPGRRPRHHGPHRERHRRLPRTCHVPHPSHR
jgi:hypothetical protein